MAKVWQKSGHSQFFIDNGYTVHFLFGKDGLSLGELATQKTPSSTRTATSKNFEVTFENCKAT